MLPALADRNFRWWLSGLFVANVGTWMQRVAQEWQALTFSHRSPVALGLVTGLQFLPTLLIAPVGGVVANRYAKRRVLVGAQLVVAACGIAIGLMMALGAGGLWEVYVFALLVGTASAIFQPASQAFLGELVGRDTLPSVVGFAAGSFHAGRLLGPGLAGLLILGGGTGPVYLTAAASAMWLVVSVIRIDRAALFPAQVTEGGLRMLADGLRYTVRNRQVLLILGMVAFIGTFAANAQVTNALMATKVFGVGAGQFGLLGSVLAVGSLAGAALSVRRKSVRLPFVVSAALAFAAANIASAVMPGYYYFAAVLLAVGLSQLTFITSANALLQLLVPAELRGRVSALYLMLLTGTTTVGAPALGMLAAHFGPRAAMVMFSGVALLGTMVLVAVLADPVARRRGQDGVADSAAGPAAETR